jgi:glycosyltransferase involved in cell wall biosynthesis
MRRRRSLNLLRAEDRLSVLLVSLTYPPALGGSEMEAQRVCAGLVARGHHVRVICGAVGPMPEKREWVDPFQVPVRIFGHGLPGRWLDLAFALRVVETVVRERENYDLVYFLMPGLHVTLCLPVTKLLGIPVVMKFACSEHITAVGKSLTGRLELYWLRCWARRIMVLNTGMVQEAAVAGLRSEQLLWMPNPVDIEEFAPCRLVEKAKIRASLGLNPDVPVTIYVGRLAPEKNLKTLLKGFSRVHQAMPAAVLALVGEGAERTSLEELADQLGIASSVRFTGRLGMPALLHWLQASDVFALVSHCEGFSCSLIEAMSTGLPSVVSKIPGNTQLIEAGVTGLIVEENDDLAIANAIITLMGNTALTTRLGWAARQHIAANYTTDLVVKRYEETFYDVARTVTVLS